MDTTGTITNFETTPATQFNGVGGDIYNIETAGKSYSITKPDSQTLRFQVQQGDNWAAGGDGSYCDRSEIQNDSATVPTSWGAVIPPGTPIGLDYQFMVEANGPNGSFVNTQNNSNGWFVVGQMHNDDIASGVGTSPPFAVQMDGDHLQIVARYVLPGGNPSNSSSALHMLTLWTDPNPIQAGAYNDIKIQANISNSGGGYLKVSINGNQVVNYQGPLGYGVGTYWEYGIYRSTASETAAVDYRNMTLVTGSQAIGWAGVGGTTSSGSTSVSGGTSSGSTTVTNPTSSTSSSGSTSSSSTSGSGTTTATTPVAPTLTIANHSLSVSPGGSVSLGLGVSVPHTGDNVSVTIAGLPKYETITDNLDHKTFSGSSVTLTAAEVNSGVTLNSSFPGKGHPTATLTVTATDATGTPITSAAQTITVVDPPAGTTSSGSSTTSSGASTASSGTSTMPQGAGASAGQSNHWWDPRGVGALTGSGALTTTSGQSSPSRTNIAQWFSDHPDFAPAATTLSEAGALRSILRPSVATTAANPTPSASATAYALLNQMMARDFGGESHFAQAATGLSGLPQQQATFLGRPLR